MEGLIWLLGVFALTFLSPFILGPFAVYFTHTIQADPEFIEIDIEFARRQLPASFYYYIDALQSLGFYPVAHLYTKGLANGTTTFLTLFINPPTEELATVSHMVCQIGLAPATTAHYLEFSTEFSDGSDLLTNNSHLRGAFKPTPEKEVFRLRKIKDPYRLYKIHRALVKQKNKPLGTLPPSGTEVYVVVRSIQRDMQRQVAFGYYFLQQTTRKYRPTIKGACLLTWKIAWPVGKIRTLLEDLKYDRIVAQLDLDQTDSYHIL